MKILLVNARHFPGGGDSAYTFRLAELLGQHGHGVAFFAMQDERNIPDPNADLFVSPIDFRELNQRKSLAGGLQVASRAIYSREARRKFGQLIDRVQPDLVHVQSLHGHLTPSVILEAQARGLPVVWTVHDYKLICPNATFLNDRTGQICEACGVSAYYQPILKRCKKGSLLASSLAAVEAYTHRLLAIRDRVQAYLPASRFLRDKLLSRGFAPGRVHQLSNFVPDDKLAPGQPGQGDYLLFMGRLEVYKGIDTLLQACRLTPQTQLILAGAANADAQRAWLNQLPANARYAGLQTGAELAKLLAGAQAVVVPSIWYENQPFSILEAFAAHKPVIASDLGGMTELITDQERGLLVPPGNAQALADAMDWLATRPDQAHTMGEQAYNYVKTEHNSETHYGKLLAVYQLCISELGAVPADTGR